MSLLFCLAFVGVVLLAGYAAFAWLVKAISDGLKAVEADRE